MKLHLALLGMALIGQQAVAQEVLQSVVTPHALLAPEQIELKNDAFVDGGGQAYLQLGFVEGEKAGVWVKVPEAIDRFKVDSFRILIGSSQVELANTQIFFTMAVGPEPVNNVPGMIENAASVTPGPYWNDVPAMGDGNNLPCAVGGQFVGAAVEFTHSGAPSVYRDLDGLSDVKKNSLFAIPGGWNYSVAYGLRGDWILRVVGHKATAEECGA